MSLFQGAAQGAMAGSSLGPYGMAAGAILGGVSGLLGNRSAKKQRQEMERMAQQRTAAYNQYGTNLDNLANQYGEASKFNAVGVRSGFGRSYMNANGEIVGELDPRYADVRDKYGNLFNSEYDRMMNFDPQALAADRYAKMQSLVAGNRAEQSEGMLGSLLRKGLIGTGATDGTGRFSNPLMAGMQRGWADEDTKMGLNAMEFADQRRREGMGLLTGFSNNMQGIDARTNDLIGQSYNWSGMVDQRNRAVLDQQYNMFGDAAKARLNAMLPQDYVSEARNAETAGKYGFWQGAAKGAQQFIPQMIGMFGQQPGGAAGGGMPTGSAYDFGQYGNDAGYGVAAPRSAYSYGGW